MDKQQIIQQHKRLHNRFANKFRPLLKKALKDQYSSYTSVLIESGVQGFYSRITNVIDSGLMEMMQSLYVHTGIERASLTFRALERLPKIQKKAAPLGFNAQWTADIIAYFRMNLFNKVVLPISETTRAYILKVIEEGSREGWSIQRMVQEIEREDYLNGRVEMILRTEINRGINYGNNVAANSYGYDTQKKWLAVHDNRTRHAHLAADGQVTNIDGMFSVGGEALDFPGDPDGSPENTIQCRCTTEIVPVRVNGRLVPKDSKPQPRIRGRLRSEIQDIIDLLNKP